MNLKSIKTEKDYKKALERLEAIFDAQPKTKEGDELETLGLLIEKYEEKHFPIETPNSISKRKRK